MFSFPVPGWLRASVSWSRRTSCGDRACRSGLWRHPNVSWRRRTLCKDRARVEALSQEGASCAASWVTSCVSSCLTEPAASVQLHCFNPQQDAKLARDNLQKLRLSKGVDVFTGAVSSPMRFEMFCQRSFPAAFHTSVLLFSDEAPTTRKGHI